MYAAEDHAAPAVIGADYVAEQNGEETQPAFVPLEQRMLDRDKDVTISMRRLDDGQLAVLAYTSLDALVAGCGDVQPWASLPVDQVSQIQARSGADVVLWDQPLPAKQRADAAAGSEVDR